MESGCAVRACSARAHVCAALRVAALTLRCEALRSSRVHSHADTMPQRHRLHTCIRQCTCRVAQRALSCVCTVRSQRVCACGVWAHFFAQGELTRPSASSGAHRPRSTLAVHGCVPDPEGGGRWKVRSSSTICPEFSGTQGPRGKRAFNDTFPQQRSPGSRPCSWETWKRLRSVTVLLVKMTPCGTPSCNQRHATTTFQSPCRASPLGTTRC